MSKRQYKSQASSSRAVTTAGFGGFGSASTGSALSYLTELPNLTTLSDANVVVAFKNLSKKDATTKAKALDDVRAYVQEHPHELDGGPEEAVLEAWVKLYPRLSIDNSRRVRELAHTIQIELLRSARKRMEKHIPKVVGSWLAGTFDRDRGVARSANDGIVSFLNTEAKVVAFWTRCQAQILEYAQETFDETPQTLSDERTVSADEVQEKYFRVVGSSVSLILNLLLKLRKEDISKCQDKYEDFLSTNKKLWGLASCEDIFTRKSVDQLLLVCLSKQPGIVEADPKTFSQSFISEALPVKQSGSAFQLLQALLALTQAHPDVWTLAIKGNKSPLSKLRRFVEKGSQGGPPEYWSAIKSLVYALPEDVTFTDSESASSFLEAMRTGVSSREEHRGNHAIAWDSYFEIARYAIDKLSDPKSIDSFLLDAVYPAFDHYLENTSASSKWAVGSIQNLVKAYSICASIQHEMVQTQLLRKWEQYGKGFVFRMQTSLPEQSKDFQKSQASVKTQGDRWFQLVGRIEKDLGFDKSEPLYGPSKNIIDAAIKVMVARNGKPLSAAATIEGALKYAPNFMSSSGSLELVKEASKKDISTILVSPSSQYIVSALFQIQSLPDGKSAFIELWSAFVEDLLANQVENAEITVITSLLSSESVSNLAQDNVDLQDLFLNSAEKMIRGDPRFWPLLEIAISFDILTDSTASKLLDNAFEHLDASSQYLDGSLRCIEILSQRPGLMNDQQVRIRMVTKLLALTELSDTVIASRASVLRDLLDKSDAGIARTHSKVSSTVHVIQQNLVTASAQSLSVNTLIQQASTVIESTDDDDVLISLFPNIDSWDVALRWALNHQPSVATAVMRPFAGAVYLVKGSSTGSILDLPTDINNYSGPLRTAIYTASLVSTKAFTKLPREKQATILCLLCLVVENLNDQLDLSTECGLFTTSQEIDPSSEIRDFVAVFQSLLVNLATSSRSWRRNPHDAVVDTHDTSATMHQLIFLLLNEGHQRIPTAYYSAKALGHLLSKLVDAHGWQNEGGDDWLTNTDVLKTTTTNYLGAVGLLTGLAEDLDSSKLVNNLCNRLVSDIAGASAQAEKTLPLLVFLNSVLAIYDDSDLPVAQNRLVFAVKQILSWTSSLATSNPQLASEACRALQKFLPAIKGVFGSYWEDSLAFCHSIFSLGTGGRLLDSNTAMIGMALKLYQILTNLQDTNDDLEDALVEYKDSINESLIGLLQLRRSKENQTQEFVDGLLSRLVVNVPPKSAGNLTDLYPLVASDFKTVQSSAFDILSRALPEVQQEISVNVLLENTDARLPEELLSLLLDAPLYSNISDDELVEFPAHIRGYLLSWHLVFSSYPTASYKVRNDYTEILKSENYIAPLLNFLFDALGHSAGKPLDLHKARFTEDEIKVYKVWDATNSESSERNLQWLLLNIYYLTLKYTPNLVKSWWLDCKSKQTRNAVESWTQKYFAPLVVQDVLDEVTKWAEEQEEPANDEKELIVKVVKRAREIYAGYEVDDMMVQIVIKLPPNYPLEGVKVEGVNRVAASEKKWASWLMITQGAITFSNGSITDGLLTFRKNVVGALAGQTECAICYSIISADKKMPDKRCLTCKNLFHSGCLFKWFASSNQNTCPLCRNPFNYGTKRGGGPGR